MDKLAWFGAHHIHNGLDQRARCKVLAGSALHVGGVLFEQALVGVALHVINRFSLAGSCTRFCALRKMVPNMPGLLHS
jgi:hypothetical protein